MLKIHNALMLSTLLSLPLIACGGGSSGSTQDDESLTEAQTAKNVTPRQARARHNNLTRDGLQVESGDYSGDEIADNWTISDAQGLIRIERDMNFDGRVDIWQYFDEKEEVYEEESDYDLDGKIDMVVFYENGVVTRQEISTNFAGYFAITKFYDKEGNLLRVERDENQDGLTDVFEYYEDDKRVRIGWDETGDGVPDKFDTL